VTLRFTNDLINAVYDRFGKSGDIVYRDMKDGHFTVTVEVETSPQFYGWLCGFGNKVKVTEPKAVRDSYQKHLEKILSLY